MVEGGDGGSLQELVPVLREFVLWFPREFCSQKYKLLDYFNDC